MSGGRLFAVVPAAGHSRRMGRPKLLLPVDGATVVARLLAALGHPDITATVVVVRRDHESLADELGGPGVIVTRPELDPPDMRASVQNALDEIEERFAPDPDDGWLLVPADHPRLTTETVAHLVGTWRETSAPILVPTFEGRRGHPTFFRWCLAVEVPAIPADRGLDHLVARYSNEIVECSIDDVGVVTDLDTPEDYDRLSSGSA